MNKEVKLGIEIQKLRNHEYQFKKIADFLKGEEKECYYFIDLKPLYDEFGYNEVNNLILELDKEVENE